MDENQKTQLKLWVLAQALGAFAKVLLIILTWVGMLVLAVFTAIFISKT